MSPADRLVRSLDFLRDRLPAPPRVLLVLGSGLGALADRIEEGVRIPYTRIPGFPRATVEGHAGTLVVGPLEGHMVAAMQGRFHLYEGWTAAEVVHPVRVLAELGVRTLLATNAAGGVRTDLEPGTLMAIRDHLNLTGRNPLVGPPLPGEMRFPDLGRAYDPSLREILHAVAKEEGIRLEEGVYAAVLGPSYETPGEVGMIAGLGADAVGMSTVPEVVVARARGIRAAAVSCITNPAAGLTPDPLSHEEVMEAGAEARDRLAALVLGTLRRLAGQEGGGP